VCCEIMVRQKREAAFEFCSSPGKKVSDAAHKKTGGGARQARKKIMGNGKKNEKTNLDKQPI